MLQINAVGFQADQPIRFKSGLLSPVYVDNRRLPFHPAQWRVIVAGFQQLIADADINADVIAGVAVGGVPHSAALGYAMAKPSVFVRKDAKEHGHQQRVEGGDVTGRRVLLVEDLVTTGGSSLSGVMALREAGAIVEDVLAIVSYGFDEAIRQFAAQQVRLSTLTDFSTILNEAHTMGRFDDQQRALIRDWFDDPQGWATRQGHA